MAFIPTDSAWFEKSLFEVGKKKPEELVDGTDKTIGDTLIEPTLIYTKAIRDVLRHYKVKNVVHGIAHITGGGIGRNIERITPDGLEIDIDANHLGTTTRI